MSSRAVKIWLILAWVVGTIIIGVVVVMAKMASCSFIVGVLTGQPEGRPCPAWEVTVFMNHEVSQGDRDEIESILNEIPQTEAITYVSSEQLAREWKAEYPDASEDVDQSPFPASFRVRVADPEQDLGGYKAALDGHPAVDKVSTIAEISLEVRAFEELWESIRNVTVVVVLAALGWVTWFARRQLRPSKETQIEQAV